MLEFTLLTVLSAFMRRAIYPTFLAYQTACGALLPKPSGETSDTQEKENASLYSPVPHAYLLAIAVLSIYHPLS